FSPESFSPRVSLTLGDDAAQHARVLRLAQGAKVELRNGRGSAATGVIARIAKRSVTIDVDTVREIALLPSVHLLVPVADRDRMLLLAEKATELAATTWRPVMWRRSRSVGPSGDGPAFQSRLKGRMIAALTQSGGGWLPDVHPTAPVTRAIAAAPAGTRLLLDAASPTPLLRVPLVAPVVLAVGPEGGLDARERDEMMEGGFHPVTLGGNTLRFETAGIAGLALVRAVLGLDAKEQASTPHREL
ncbi:MAG TPA: RsmE family RNA methyltransferase, partial [Gemmatimonadaceae bacterium]|nr:RsmE family RNA methyltransferase [Gemmatimonadaceae bacterium]